MDEDIAIIGEINKEKVRSEYFRRIRKIWNSELYCRHKITAHNTFAIAVITPTFGILPWTKEELQQIDIKTRKLLTLSGSFHVNSDVDRLYHLYCHRNEGGRGLNSVNDTYISRIVYTSKDTSVPSRRKRSTHEVCRNVVQMMLTDKVQTIDAGFATRKLKRFSISLPVVIGCEFQCIFLSVTMLSPLFSTTKSR